MRRPEHRPTPNSIRRVASAGIITLTSLCFLVAVPGTSNATILPPNDLWKQDNRFAATGITEQQFNSILDLIELRYRPEFFFFNATLVINRFWDDPTVNSYARRTGNNWIIDMYGGLARRAEITPDGFALVACHEVGHHLGGYPFFTGSWGAVEGEADTYATQACARYIWRSDPANADIARNAPQIVRDRCDAAWANTADRELCCRIAMAGKSLSDLLGVLDGHQVDYSTPDTQIVRQTASGHPAAQRRLDTYFAGALCGVFFNFDIIPGVGDPIGQNSPHAEITAATASCLPASLLMGTPGYNGQDRPRCWFAPQVH
jgi:hypothetical protein